jgi:hypothetical protein
LLQAKHYCQAAQQQSNGIKKISHLFMRQTQPQQVVMHMRLVGLKDWSSAPHSPQHYSRSIQQWNSEYKQWHKHDSNSHFEAEHSQSGKI